MGSLPAPGSLYHTGVLVTDLETSMRELGRSLGLHWGGVVDNTVQVAMGDGTRAVRFRCTYSCEGPHRIELVEKVAGTLWSGPTGLHHLGYWSEDLIADGRALEAVGAPTIAVHVPEEGGEPLFRYHADSTGVFIELVTVRRRAGLERWLAESLAQAEGICVP